MGKFRLKDYFNKEYFGFFGDGSDVLIGAFSSAMLLLSDSPLV